MLLTLSRSPQSQRRRHPSTYRSRQSGCGYALAAICSHGRSGRRLAARCPRDRPRTPNSPGCAAGVHLGHRRHSHLGFHRFSSPCYHRSHYSYLNMSPCARIDHRRFHCGRSHLDHYRSRPVHLSSHHRDHHNCSSRSRLGTAHR